MSNILERDNWLDTSVDFMISDIVEYDMRRAGLSISKDFKLLPESKIKEIESMEKGKADRILGLIQRSDKEYKEKLKEGFKLCRIKFGELNELTDDDILSVKKDAIFVKRYCEYTQVYENIEFREKHHYEAYMILKSTGNTRLEFYWGSDGILDVKGITEENVKLHAEFMMKMIWTFIKYLTQYDYDGARKYLIKFIDKYKFGSLPMGYYREFNAQSMYSYIMFDAPTTATYLDESYKHLVIRNYNYLNILVPLLQFVL